MIDIRKLKELVRLMVDNDLSELDLQDQQETVTISGGGNGRSRAAPVVHHAPAAVVAAAPVAAVADAGDEPKAEVEVKDVAGLVPIISPMVGTPAGVSGPEPGVGGVRHWRRGRRPGFRTVCRSSRR